MANSAIDILLKATDKISGPYQKMVNNIESSNKKIVSSTDATGKKMVSIFDGSLKKMDSSSRASTSNISKTFDALNSKVNFNGMVSKFDAAMKRMAQSAQAGSKSISSSLSSSSAGIDDLLTGALGGVGIYTLFEGGMQKAVTQQMLKNKGLENLYPEYQKYTIASSTSDADLNRVFNYVMTTKGIRQDQVYRAMGAIESAGYDTDPVQKLKDTLAFSAYLQGGWDVAGKRMADEPIPEDIKKKMQEAKTPEERIAVMEEYAKLKGTMDKFGMSLSTTTEGEMGAFNAALTASDSIMRALTKAFTSLLVAIRPVFDWFNKLSPETQNLIGQIILAAGAFVVLMSGIKILTTVLTPLKDILGKIPGMPDWLTGKKDITTATMNVKAGTVNVDGEGGTPGGGSGGGKMGWIERLGWSLAPGATAAYLSGGIRGLAMSGATTVGNALSGFGGPIGAAISGLFLNPTPDVKGSGSLLSGNYDLGYAWQNSGMGSLIPSDWSDPNKPGTLANQLNLPGWLSANLFPTASAAGNGGNQGIMNDIFGKNGVLDFSRFGINIPEFKWPNITVDSIIDPIKKIIPDFKWPDITIDSITKFVKDKIGWLKFPNITWDSVSKFVKDKIGWLNFPSISWDSVAGWVKSHVGWLNFPSISWDSVAAWIKEKIPWLKWPGGPGGYVSNLVNTGNSIVDTAKSTASQLPIIGPVGSWLGWWKPTGPRGPLDGLTFRYKDYEGTNRQNPWEDANTLVGNCFDMTLGLMSRYGGSMVWGTWNDNSHVWWKAPDGRQYDPSRKALNNTFTPPPRGPNSGGSAMVKNEVHIHYNAPLYGEDAIKKSVNDALNQSAKHVNIYPM
jgi:hypothetical protein